MSTMPLPPVSRVGILAKAQLRAATPHLLELGEWLTASAASARYMRRRPPRCAVSHSPSSSRCGVAARKCDFARIPTRETGGSGSVDMCACILAHSPSRSAVAPAWRRCMRNSRLPVAPVIGDGVMPHARQSGCCGVRGDSREHRVVHRRIADDASFADLVAARLRTAASPARRCRRRGARNVGTSGRMCFSEMNDTSIVTMSTACGTSVGVSARAFTPSRTMHARIAAQLPVELAVADVERDDMACAALQQHVGESAGRRADVERAAALDGNARRCRAHARASARRVRHTDGPGVASSTCAACGDRRAGLGHDLAVDAHLSGKDHRACAFARRRRARAPPAARRAWFSG